MLGPVLLVAGGGDTLTIAPARAWERKWLTAAWQPVTAKATLATMTSMTSTAVTEAKSASPKTAALFTFPTADRQTRPGLRHGRRHLYRGHRQ
jgi:hypothetical protein